MIPALILLFVLAGLHGVLLCRNAIRVAGQNRAVFEWRQQEWATRLERARSDLERAWSKQALGWQGTRRFLVNRKQFENDTRTICSFTLWPADEKPLPPFEPGQFLGFEFDVPGRRRTVTRCYSISDSPNGECFRISVRRVEGGLVSRFLHDEVREGDTLRVRAPTGQFHIDLQEDSPVVLLAGGVGVTPLLSMFNAIAETSPGREAWLFYAARTRADIAHEEEIERSRRQGRHLHVRYVLSHEQHRDCLSGYLDPTLLDRELPSSDYDFYLCGPPPMMEALTSGLANWGVPASRMHQEAFGPASAQPREAGSDTTTVRFESSGEEFTWNPDGGSLVEQAAKAGVTIPVSCGAGVCGTCRCVLSKGRVSYPKPPGVRDLAANECLPCVCVPASPELEIQT